LPRVPQAVEQDDVPLMPQVVGTFGLVSETLTRYFPL
jgi:hypothetical protein